MITLFLVYYAISFVYFWYFTGFVHVFSDAIYDWQTLKEHKGFDADFCKKHCKRVEATREYVVVQASSDVIYAIYDLPGADSKLPSEPLYQLDISRTKCVYALRVFSRARKLASTRVQESKKLKQEGEYQNMIRSVTASLTVCKLRVPIISKKIRNTPISYTVDSEEEQKNETSMYFMMYITALFTIYHCYIICFILVLCVLVR